MVTRNSLPRFALWTFYYIIMLMPSCTRVSTTIEFKFTIYQLDTSSIGYIYKIKMSTISNVFRKKE